MRNAGHYTDYPGVCVLSDAHIGLGIFGTLFAACKINR